MVDDANVGKEKLGSADDPAFRTLPVSWEPATEQGVFEDLEMAFDGVTRNSAVACDGREIYQLGVGKRRHIEKFGKNREISHESFRRHFFFQIVGDVRVQQAPWGIRRIDSRQIPVVENAIQIEIFTDLGGSQTVKFITHRSASKQIGLAALNLAGARTTEGEMNTTILVQPVGFIEQLRNLLHLVDHYLADGLLSGELGSEQFRVVQIAAKFLGFEQVYPQSVRISGSQQCGLTGLTGSPKEKGSPCRAWEVIVIE